MENLEILKVIKDKVNELFKDEDTGHDISHLLRVLDYATKIQSSEGGDAYVISVASLVHDIHRLLSNKNNHYVSDKDSLEIVKQLLIECNINMDKLDAILEVVKYHDEKDLKGLNLETLIVQDADILDALGEVGLERTLKYCKTKNIPLINLNYSLDSKEYIPEINPLSTCHYIYRTMIPQASKLHTSTAKEIAKGKVEVLEKFLKDNLDKDYLNLNKRKILVEVSYPIELIATVVILADSFNNKVRCNKKYYDEVKEYFKKYKDHKMISYFKDLEDNYCFNYDKVVISSLDLYDDYKISDTCLSYLINKECINKLVCYKEYLSDFEKESNFKQFYDNHLKEYQEAINHFKSKVDVEGILNFLFDLVKVENSNNYVINLMFGITSSNYGWSTSKANYCNIRPYKLSSRGEQPDFAYDRVYVETLILHEFLHPLINPLTDKYENLIDSFNKNNIKETLDLNPYGEDFKTVINETIIRAMECLYLKEKFNLVEYKKLIEKYHNEGFIYLDKIINIISDESNLSIDKYFETLVRAFQEKIR